MSDFQPSAGAVDSVRRRHTWRYARALLAIASLCAGCAGPLDDPAAPPKDCTLEPGISTFVVLPDSQFYACAYPDIFASQTEWIAEHAVQESIGLVIHTGDMVDTNNDAQWSVASDAMHRLDGEVPYLLAPGNHDLAGDRGTLLDDYFSAAALNGGGCTEMGFKDSGRVENSYAIVSLRGRPWLFVGLEFGPRDAVLDWASEVLGKYRGIPAVLFTHAYLYADNDRYDRAQQPPQPYHPDSYQITPEQGIADGQDIWETLVVPYENVRLILSGHVVPDGTARATITMPSGRVVHEVLANYQQCDSCPCAAVEGGGGYLRMLTLDEGGTVLHVSTYSPYKGQSLTDAENSFDLEL